MYPWFSCVMIYLSYSQHIFSLGRLAACIHNRYASMVKLLYKYRVKHCPDIHPILCFSSKSHGHVAGRVGSTALDFEIGEGRWITEFSTVRMLYNIGIQTRMMSNTRPHGRADDQPPGKYSCG
ncbi:unnamed protein product [Triticum turgidum subsp. durum]|uniref:Uncharacterized protein n=1 Tax=Triticum turgidum subsp. durum TaxID=4567 RepID=A0A9R0ZCR5_TRITD|nr:unnamed protein product [Triticum turgidum subsp. durum]